MASKKVSGGSIDLTQLAKLADGIPEAGRVAADRLLAARVGRIASLAVRQVPVRTGKLKASIVNVDRSAGDSRVRVTGVAPDKPAAGYARFVRSTKYGPSRKGPARHVMTAHFREPSDTLRKELPALAVEAIAKEIDDG